MKYHVKYNDSSLWQCVPSSRLRRGFGLSELNLRLKRKIGSPIYSSYLCRKTACHSREQERLDENMFLLMCYYNFIRPHMALNFGKEIRTPAMQAGLVSKKLSFRDLFTSQEVLFLFVVIVVLVWRENGLAKPK